MVNNHRTDVEYDMSYEYPGYEIAGYYKAVYKSTVVGKVMHGNSRCAIAKADGQLFGVVYGAYY